jgi:FkbM family methyltransferase
MTRLGGVFESTYLRARQAIRKLVISNPALDRSVGKALVRIDLAIRKTGILDRGLSKGFLEHRGFKIHFGEEDRGLASFLLNNRDYEAETREVIERQLREGDVFLDLGANIGFFTLLAGRIVGDSGRVIAFEPTPRTRAILQRNVTENGLDGRVWIDERAITEKRGRAHFTVLSDSEYNSVVSDDRGGHTIEVETISVDDYISDHGISRVAMVKMDIEGQELPALRGMRETISENPWIKVIFEYHQARLAESSVKGVALFDLLRDYGLDCFTMLFREPRNLKMPADMTVLEKTAERANVNILAERSAK